MKNATLDEVINLSRACFAHICMLEKERGAEKAGLNRPGHIEAIESHIASVKALQARVDAWADEIEANKLPPGMKRYRVCMSWGSREEGTFEEIYTARDEDDAERQCREAMAASDGAGTPEEIAERVAENSEYWYLIHCLPES